MKKLKHTGEGYHGSLPEGENGTLYAKPGEVVEVSDAKAAQLFADFPQEWELVADAAGGPVVEPDHKSRSRKGK